MPLSHLGPRALKKAWQHHSRDRVDSQQTMIEWVTAHVSSEMGNKYEKQSKHTESAQCSPFLFVNSVSPFHGLSRKAFLHPSRRRVICWKDSIRSSAVLRRSRS